MTTSGQVFHGCVDPVSQCGERVLAGFQHLGPGQRCRCMIVLRASCFGRLRGPHTRPRTGNLKVDIGWRREVVPFGARLALSAPGGACSGLSTVGRALASTWRAEYMAYVTGFVWGDDRHRLHPSSVTLVLRKVEVSDGTHLVQLDSAGSDTRENRGKLSQTLQLDRDGARALVLELQRLFPGV